MNLYIWTVGGSKVLVLAELEREAYRLLDEKYGLSGNPQPDGIFLHFDAPVVVGTKEGWLEV